MARCNKCNTEVGDEVKFCPLCGTPINESAVYSGIDEQTAERIDIETNKSMAIFSYIWILVLIPLLAAPKSKFARFHANQGLVLFIGEAALGVFSSVITTVFGFIPILGVILNILISIASGAVGVAFFVLAIMGIMDVVNGKKRELPFIGKIKLLK